MNDDAPDTRPAIGHVESVDLEAPVLRALRPMLEVDVFLVTNWYARLSAVSTWERFIWQSRN